MSIFKEAIEQIEWLGKKDEVQLDKNKYTGKMAGKAWKYSQSLDRLIQVRAFLLIMSALVFYPIITNYVIYDVYSPDLLIERIVFCIILLISGLLFNRYRVFSMLLSMVPLILILLTYLTVEGQFNIKRVGFTFAVIILVISGIYHHFKLKPLKRELENYLIENPIPIKEIES